MPQDVTSSPGISQCETFPELPERWQPNAGKGGKNVTCEELLLSSRNVGSSLAELVLETAIAPIMGIFTRIQVNIQSQQAREDDIEMRRLDLNYIH